MKLLSKKRNKPGSRSASQDSDSGSMTSSGSDDEVSEQSLTLYNTNTGLNSSTIFKFKKYSHSVN